jgi:hypothetical protein
MQLPAGCAPETSPHDNWPENRDEKATEKQGEGVGVRCGDHSAGDEQNQTVEPAKVPNRAVAPVPQEDRPDLRIDAGVLQ